MAAHLHDSVLQTLALIQRHADDQQAVSRLARSQERELRAWLYDPKVVREGGTWAGLVAGMVAEVEADHALDRRPRRRRRRPDRRRRSPRSVRPPGRRWSTRPSTPGRPRPTCTPR